MKQKENKNNNKILELDFFLTEDCHLRLPEKNVGSVGREEGMRDTCQGKALGSDSFCRLLGLAKHRGVALWLRKTVRHNDIQSEIYVHQS